MAIAGRNHKRGATFGSRCLDLGTVIAGKTSHSVKMAAAGRMCDCGPTFGSRCLGTVIAGFGNLVGDNLSATALGIIKFA